MSGFIKQTFIVLVLVLLGSGGSLTAKCIPINNQLCIVRPTFIDFSPDKLHYYSLIISLGRCDGSCNTVVPNKIEDVNFQM